MREEAEDVVATAKRVGDGKKEMARAAEMVAMGGAEWWPVRGESSWLHASTSDSEQRSESSLVLVHMDWQWMGLPTF